MVLPVLGKTRPGGPLPRPLNYQSDLLYHLRAADLLLGHKPGENVLTALTGELGTFSRASAGGYTRDALGYLTQWGQGVPRIKMYDLDDDGYYEEPGLLLEGQRENGFTKSIELNDGAWNKTRSSASTNVADAPDRTLTADKLIEDGTGASTHYVTRNTPALSDDTEQSWSVFVKAVERSEIELRLHQKNGSIARVWFDLSAGTVGTASGGGVGLIDKHADGWYRCMLMADSSNGGTTTLARVFLGSGGETSSYDGDGSSGVYLWGMQFEVDQAFPSSFIITAGSTITRVADALSYTLAWLGQTITEDLDDVTVYARMPRPLWADASGDIGQDRGFVGISSATRRIRIRGVDTVRNFEVRIDTATTDAVKAVAIPSGSPLEISVQSKNLRTGGQAAVDVGSGLSAFSAAATALSSWGNTTLLVGKETAGATEFDGVLFELKIARGLRTMKQMQEAF